MIIHSLVTTALLLTSFSTLAQAAPGREVLTPFLPENNSACRSLTPIPFKAVILAPGMSCADTVGVTQIVQTVNSWLPQNAIRPQIALLMKPVDSNAFFSYYALNVPLRIQGDNARGSRRYFPSALSRGVVAHEYGHAVLHSTLATTNAEYRDAHRLFRTYGELMAIQQILTDRGKVDYDKLVAEFDRKYGTSDKWTPEQQSSYERAMEELSQKYAGASDYVVEQINAFEGKVSPRNKLILESLSSYHEFFADLVAVLDAKDWAISGKLIAALMEDKAAGVPRDFTDAANSYNNSSAYDSHDLLGPARYAFYSYLKNRRCLNPNPKLLLGVVIDAIREHSRTTIGSAQPSTVAARMSFNRAFMNAITWRLDRSAGLCSAR